MKRSILCLFVVLSILSCGTTKQPNLRDYYNQKPNLTQVSYAGGDGKSLENAIIITDAKNSLNGIAAEYADIEKGYGARSTDWIFISQGTKRTEKSVYDIISFKLVKSDEIITLHFNITGFYGKL